MNQHEQALERLHKLVQTDPTVAPLARLQLEAWRAAPPIDDADLPAFDRGQVVTDTPLLEGQSLAVDVDGARTLVERLITVAGQTQHQGKGRKSSELDPLAFMEASITWNWPRLEEIAAAAKVEFALLVAVGQVAVMPLLQRVGQKAATVLEGRSWRAGYCPTCAAWPAIAERRGLQQERWLHCGRCSTAWKFSRQHCVFCHTADFRAQGYLAPEDERESKQAVTCDQCRGYLKTVTTVRALGGAEICLQDLTTLELDMAALENGYTRPDRPGFPLNMHLIPATRPTGWFRWRR